MGEHPGWRVWSGGWREGRPPAGWWRGRDARWYPPGVTRPEGGGTWRGSVAEVRPHPEGPELVTVGGSITGPEAEARLAHPAGRAGRASSARPSPDIWSSWSPAPTSVAAAASTWRDVPSYPVPARGAAASSAVVRPDGTAPDPDAFGGPGDAPGPVRARPAVRRPRAGAVAAVAAVAVLALGAAGWSALRADPPEPQAEGAPPTAPCGVDLDGDGDLDTC